MALMFGPPAASASDAPVDEPYGQAIVELKDGDALDLDSGKLVGTAAGAAELAVAGGEIRFVQPRMLSKTFAAIVGPVSTEPWSEMTTTDGRMAAVQVLRSVTPITVRYVVAPRGVSAWRPAPQDPHCIGAPGKIDVWFEPDAAYARFRIERRVGPAGDYSIVGTVDRPPYTDTAIDADVRYGYRIVGMTSANERGVPAEVQGTTRSRGVFAGSVVFQFGATVKSCDLLRSVISPDVSDMVFKGTLGGFVQARFTGSAGCAAYQCDLPDSERGSPYDLPVNCPVVSEIDRGAPYYVALAGGGVARCVFDYNPVPTVPRGLPDVRVDYLVNPDAPVLGPLTQLSARREPGGGVRVKLFEPSRFTLGRIDVLGPDGAVIRSLDAKGGEAVDAPPPAETYRTYSAAAMDAKGRAAVPGRAVLDERTAAPESGRIHLRRGTCYSFASRSTVPMEACDLLYLSDNGDVATTLDAPGGLAAVETLTTWHRTGVPTLELFESLISLDARTIALRRSQTGDARFPEDEVFVLRCRSGGWARFAILERQYPKERSDNAITLRYTFNPREPVFDPERPVVQSANGLRFSREVFVQKLR